MWNTGIIMPDSVPCLLTMLSLHTIPRSFGVAYRSQYFTRLEKKKKRIDTNLTLFFQKQCDIMIRWISSVWRGHFALICGNVFHLNFRYAQRTILWDVNSFLFTLGSSVCVHSRYILPTWLLSIAVDFRSTNTPSHKFKNFSFLLKTGQGRVALSSSFTSWKVVCFLSLCASP